MRHLSTFTALLAGTVCGLLYCGFMFLDDLKRQ
jgi:hypothetical protein